MLNRILGHLRLAPKSVLLAVSFAALAALALPAQANTPATSPYTAYASGSDPAGDYGGCDVSYGAVGTGAESPYGDCVIAVFDALNAKYDDFGSGPLTWTGTVVSPIQMVYEGTGHEYYNSNGVPVGHIDVYLNLGCNDGGKLGGTLQDSFGDGYTDWCLIPYTGQPVPTENNCPADQKDLTTGHCNTLTNTGCPCETPAKADPKAGDKPKTGAASGFGGDPIDLGAGNLYEGAIDYEGGGAFPLVFTRSYNSAAANAGGNADDADQSVGNGWTANLAPHLTVYIKHPDAVVCTDNATLTHSGDANPNYGKQFLCPGFVLGADLPGGVTVWHTDGSRDTFTAQFGAGGVPDTAFTPEPGSKGALSFNGVSYVYESADGEKDYFSVVSGEINFFVSAVGATWRLTQVTNAQGLSQYYFYIFTVGGFYRQPVLQTLTVKDTAGRQMVVNYDTGSGRVASLTVPAMNATAGTASISYHYDASGNLQTVTYPDGSVLTYEYNDTALPHALTGLKDENGNEYTAWSYDDSTGKVICSEHAPSGNLPSTATTCNGDTNGIEHTTVSYGSQTAAITEASGLQRNMTFAAIGGKYLFTGVDQPCPTCGDLSKTIAYDSNGDGYIAQITDFDGNTSTYQHDTSTGLELSRTEGVNSDPSKNASRTITTTWCGAQAVNGNNCINPFYAVNTVSAPGLLTAYTYYPTGQLEARTVTDSGTSQSRTTSYAYYPSGLLYTVKDPLGHVTTFTYTGGNTGDLQTITNALGQKTTISSYTANGLPLTIVDPNGVTTTLTYDARQRLTSRTVAGATTTFTYDKAGQLTQVTLPTGSFLKYSYDRAQRLTGIADSTGDSIAYTLDAYANHTQEQTKDPSGTLTKTLSRTYNSLDQLITVVGGAGQTTTYAPDLNGNLTSITDPLHNASTQAFDALNRLVAVVDPESGNTTYNYDALDRVQDVTDPKGLNTHYSYDGFSEVTQLTSPDTGVTSYSYDLDGNRFSKADAKGVTATYSYDALNRLTGVTYPDSSLNVTYTYDQGPNGIGRLTGMTDKSGTTAYSYDTHGNKTQKVVTLGGHTFTVGYQYDSADNLIGMTYPSGLQVSYQRDAAERVTAVTANGSPVASGITYEPFGPITSLTYGNGLTETRTYDQDYRLTGINVPGVLDWTLQDNADDDVLSITDKLNGSSSQSFGYDKLNRLTSASGAYGALSLGYDLDGNRLNENSTAYSYDNASNHILSVGTAFYQYDANGNTVKDGHHSYSYDASNRLASYDVNTGVYVYNGLGQRVEKLPGIKDTTPPTVAITAPANGATVSGTVSVAADASDNVAVASVQFQLDGANLGSAVTAAPYVISWNTSGVIPGTHSLTAIATDTAGNSATSVSVRVTVADVAATANDGILATSAGTTVTGTLSATAAYSRQTLTFALATSPAHGTATITSAATGAFTYTPAAGYVGSDSFTFTVTDGFGTVSNTATESVTVTDVAATANNGNLSTPVQQSFSGSLSATQAYQGQTLTYALIASPVHGTVTLTDASSGTFSYTPTAGYVGADSFTFTVTDSYGTVSNTATESVTVTDVAATANNGTVNTTPDLVVSRTLSATPAYNSQTLNFALATNPAHGTVAITNAATGAFTYTPVTGYAGSDSFTFTVTDNYGTVSNTATVGITVKDVAATSANGAVNTTPDLAVSGTLSATAAYVGQTLNYALATNPVHGSLSFNAGTGAFTYTPALGYAGSDSFTFNVTDQYGTVSNTATGGVTVTDVAATAGNGSVSTTPDVTVSGTLSGAAAYQGQILTFSLAANPSHGTVSLNAGTGAFSYTPTTGYAGSDSFTFKVTDAYGMVSNIATESVTINDVPPQANSASITVIKNRSASDAVSATAAYSGQTLTFNLVSGPANGTLTFDATTGAFTYTPTKGFEGADGFTFTVTDQWGTVSAVATEALSVVKNGHGHK